MGPSQTEHSRAQRGRDEEDPRPQTYFTLSPHYHRMPDSLDSLLSFCILFSPFSFFLFHSSRSYTYLYLSIYIRIHYTSRISTALYHLASSFPLYTTVPPSIPPPAATSLS